jgi:hypothetical protein
MYLTEKEEILHLKDENKELRERIAKMTVNMNDMWREIILLKEWKRNHQS